MKERLQTKIDYYMVIFIWGLFIFTFFSILALERFFTAYSGFSNAISFFTIFGFLPFGLSIGIVGDRYYADLELKKQHKNEDINLKSAPIKLNREDKIRIFLIILTTIISLPWINALAGIYVEGFNIAIPILGIEGLKAHLIPFFPVHLGLNHGWLGYFLIISSILNSKIEKLFEHTFLSELIIFGFCLISIWGTGWLINDFVSEQIAPIFPGTYFPFLIPSWSDLFRIEFVIQVIIVFGLAFLMYYFGWRKYYRRKIIKER